MRRAGWAMFVAPALGVAAWAIWCASPAPAHEAITTEITWTRNVSRIFYLRCATCHRQGGPAPMPLTSYAEVRPWAKAIKHEVLARRMPPWGAVKGFGAFRNDISLSLPEVALISSWVEGGAPEGDRAFSEPFHDHPQGSPEQAATAARLSVRGSVRLVRDLVAAGVSAAASSAGWLQLTAHLPDGGVEHLIWLRGPRPSLPQDYWFLRRINLPRGTRLVCAPPSAAVDLRFLEPPPQDAP